MYRAPTRTEETPRPTLAYTKPARMGHPGGKSYQLSAIRRQEKSRSLALLGMTNRGYAPAPQDPPLHTAKPQGWGTHNPRTGLKTGHYIREKR